MARVCVEADISKDLPKKLFLEGKQKIIQQQIIYEDLPSFCTDCRRLGHATSKCGQLDHDQPPPKPQKSTTRWTPKKGQKVSTLDPSSVSLLHKNTDHDLQTSQRDDLAPTNTYRQRSPPTQTDAAIPDPQTDITPFWDFGMIEILD